MEELRGKTGVYIITNILDGKVYIGSTTRCLLTRYVKEHRALLRKGKHKNRYLQRAWNKDGEESFSFQVAEFCRPEDCVDIEQVYIDTYQSSNRNFGYNISPIASAVTGIRHSDESKLKMSIWHLSISAETKKIRTEKMRAGSIAFISTLTRQQRSDKSKNAHRNTKSAVERRQLASIGQKQCKRCRVIKPIDVFTKDKRSADKLSYWCRSCKAKARTISYYLSRG